VDAVVGLEVRSVGGVLAGLMGEDDAAEMAAKRLEAFFDAGEVEEAAGKNSTGAVVGLVGAASSGGVHYLFSPYYCKVREHTSLIHILSLLFFT
jgi:glycerol-3-phosphate acyltransferase